MSDELQAELIQIVAAWLDHPSVYMGGPSERSRRRAEGLLVEIIPRIRKAEQMAIATDLRRIAEQSEVEVIANAIRLVATALERRP